MQTIRVTQILHLHINDFEFVSTLGFATDSKVNSLTNCEISGIENTSLRTFISAHEISIVSRIWEIIRLISGNEYVRVRLVSVRYYFECEELIS